MSESETPIDPNSTSGGDPADPDTHQDPIAAAAEPTIIAETEVALSQIRINTTNTTNPADNNGSDDSADSDSNSNSDDDDENFLAMLPKCVKARVEKLKELHKSKVQITEQYLIERAALEMKFSDLYAPLYDERAEVVSGKQDVEIAAKAAAKVSSSGTKAANSTEAAADTTTTNRLTGVPEFWSCAMANIETISELLTERDNEALLHLSDIKCHDFDDGRGFTLTFHFTENAFFTNPTLTKRYEVPNLLLDDEPILKNVKGCEIDWKQPDMCLTWRETLKKQRNKSGRRAGQIRTIKKKERVESFFHFFSPPKIPNMKFGEIGEEEADAIEEAFDHDYDVAQSFRSHIIPKAALWFTGEAMEEEIENMMHNGGLPEGLSATLSSSSSPFPPSQTGPEEPECKQN